MGTKKEQQQLRGCLITKVQKSSNKLGAGLSFHRVQFDILWHGNKGSRLGKERRRVCTRQHIQWDLQSEQVRSSCSSLEALNSPKVLRTAALRSRPFQMIVLLKLRQVHDGHGFGSFRPVLQTVLPLSPSFGWML